MNNLPEDTDYIQLLVSSIDKLEKVKDSLLEKMQYFYQTHERRFNPDTIETDLYKVEIYNTEIQIVAPHICFFLRKEFFHIFAWIDEYVGNKLTLKSWRQISNTSNYIRRIITAYPEEAYTILRVCAEVPELIEQYEYSTN